MSHEAPAAQLPALPAWQRQLPLTVVMGFVAAGLLFMTLVSGTTGYRVGLCSLATGLFIGAVARGTLTTRRIGLLAVRSRPFDVVLLLGCAAGIVVLALSLPPAT